MDVFSALADPVRRAILARLAHGPARVVDLTAEHHITRPAVSRHLRLLLDAGLVDARTVGRERPYHLTPEALAPVHDLLAALGTRATALEDGHRPGSKNPVDAPGGSPAW